MFCTKCGNQMPDGSRFCTSCGAAMAVPAAPVAGDTYEQAPAAREPVLTEAPVFAEEATPVEEAPSYETAPLWEETPETEPFYTPQQEAASTEEALPAEPVEKKSGKKRIILLAAAAAVVLALLVSMIALIVAGSSPEAKLFKAAEKSGEELAELMDDSHNFVAMMENAQALYEKQEMTLKAGYSMKQEMSGYYKMENSIALQINASQKDKELSAEGSLVSNFEYPDYPEYSYSQDYKVALYADEKEMIAAMPEALDAAYSLPLKKLGEKLFVSDLGKLLEDELDDEAIDALQKLDVNLFADTGWAAFQKAYPDEAKDFMDSLVIEKSDMEIPEAEEGLKVYSITWDMKDLSDLIVAYQRYSIEEALGEDILRELDDVEDDLRDSLEDMEDYEFVVYAGIRKGCLTALHVEVDDGYEESELTFLLEGKENLWNDFKLYVDGEKLMTGGVEKTEDGFEVEMKADGEKIVIECDDAACELILAADGEEIVVGYGAENKGCQLFFEQNEDETKIVVSLELLPMEQIEKQKDAVNLLELDKDDLEDIAKDLEDALS